jgi:hypothetical protein
MDVGSVFEVFSVVFLYNAELSEDVNMWFWMAYLHEILSD